MSRAEERAGEVVGESAPARGQWAVWFVAVALMALAGVPAYLGSRVDEVQRVITEVMEPAGRLSSSLSLLKARQFARLEGFLLTGDRSFREPYIAAIAEEDSVFTQLGVLTSDPDFQVRDLQFNVRERLAQLSAESTRWHLRNQQIFDASVAPSASAQVREESRMRYDELQRATRELDRAIQSAVRGGRLDVENVRTLQLRITMALAVLALWATLLLGRVGARLKNLTLEAEMRRRDAVRARREIDSLLEATGDGVLGIDLEGTCISLNRAGVDLLGYSEREMQGRDVHEALHHSFPDGTPRPREESPILKALVRGEAAESEDGDVLWRRRGLSFPARWSLRPMMDGVELRGAVLTFTDMTEIMEKERALRQAIRQREDVVSIVSHDLRNPLGVVFGAADLLLELPLDAEQRSRQAQIISRAARRMQTLIEDLLDVARIEAGALVVRRSLEDLPEILEETRDLFDDQAEQRGISLSVEPSATSPRARVDRDRLLQALSNLVDNALRLTPEGGSVVLSAEDAGERVAVRVRDTGPGIEPAKLSRLFDRFWQMEDGMPGAAGLGLAIVKGVVEAHGGEVRVASEVGVGTTFTLWLANARELGKSAAQPGASLERPSARPTRTGSQAPESEAAGPLGEELSPRSGEIPRTDADPSRSASEPLPREPSEPAREHVP
jgi:PAS domain S-box-containing protein